MSLTEGSQRLFKFVPDEFVAQLPPRCSTNDFVITMKMKKIQKRGGVVPPKNLLTAQLHRAVFHSRFVMFH
ncbi:hypothetical protein EYJ13_03960 [Salmonella enterica]|nr:hypothetical protein [Salmonella enterica]